jgi:hypothetical protein
MAKAVGRDVPEQPSGKAVGRNLRQVRKQQGLFPQRRGALGGAHPPGAGRLRAGQDRRPRERSGGRHVLELTLRADQLQVRVDGEPVLDIDALSRATVEVGREPCRGDRVGVQAWSTTEVTIESFRVAVL